MKYALLYLAVNKVQIINRLTSIPFLSLSFSGEVGQPIPVFPSSNPFRRSILLFPRVTIISRLTSTSISISSSYCSKMMPFLFVFQMIFSHLTIVTARGPGLQVTVYPVTIVRPPAIVTGES